MTDSQTRDMSHRTQAQCVRSRPRALVRSAAAPTCGSASAQAVIATPKKDSPTSNILLMIRGVAPIHACRLSRPRLAATQPSRHTLALTSRLTRATLLDDKLPRLCAHTRRTTRLPLLRFRAALLLRRGETFLGAPKSAAPTCPAATLWEEVLGGKVGLVTEPAAAKRQVQHWAW